MRLAPGRMERPLRGCIPRVFGRRLPVPSGTALRAACGRLSRSARFPRPGANISDASGVQSAEHALSYQRPRACFFGLIFSLQSERRWTGKLCCAVWGG
jgi:hypothetical protein